jgi:hypothetical protein
VLRGGATQVRFSELPANSTGDELLFETPRRIQIAHSNFHDWFAPCEVHIYRFQR